jgi:DUF1009 family protein
MSTTDARSSAIGIIAAGGPMPFAVADSIAASHREPIVFALKGLASTLDVARFKHHWIAIGQLGRLFRLLRNEHCRDVVFIGTMVRPALSEIRMDLTTLRLMPQILSAFRGGDDHLLSGIGRLFERQGLHLRGVAEIAPDLLMPAGCLTRATPSPDAQADIAKGRALLAALGPYDVGQAVVVLDGHVIGVEGIEGTDDLLARIKTLRSEGRIRASSGRGVLVKAPKPTQDLRYDLPTLGARTVAGVADAGLAGIAISAGQSILADAQTLVRDADKASIFVIGLAP